MIFSHVIGGLGMSAERRRKASCQSPKSTRATSIRSAQRAGCGAAAHSLPLRSRSIFSPFFFCTPCPGPIDTKQFGQYQAVRPDRAGECFQWKQVETPFGNKLFLLNQSLSGTVSSVSNSSRARHAKRARARARVRKGGYGGNNGNNGNSLNKTLRYNDNPVSNCTLQLETLGNSAASIVGEAQNSAVSDKIGAAYSGIGADLAAKGFSLAGGGENFRDRIIGRPGDVDQVGASSCSRPICSWRSGAVENGGFLRFSGPRLAGVGTAMLERSPQSRRNPRFLDCRRKLGRLTERPGGRSPGRGARPPRGAARPSPARPLPRLAGF